MKKICLSISALLFSAFFLWAVPNAQIPQVELNPAHPLKSFNFIMNGSWLPAINPLHVGPNNYTEVKNLRPTKSGYETVEGFTKINTTATSTPINVHHFSKENESHVIAKIEDSGSYYLYDNTTAIPSQGDFDSTALKQVSSGLGSFSNGPQGTMFYADNSNSLVWGGNELKAAAFLSGNSASGSDVKDYTQFLSNGVTSSSATIGSGGDDSYAVLLLHGDGADASTTITDDGATGHTVTATGDAQIDTSNKKFGTGSILFDGSGDYGSIPDHADFYMGTGNATLDFWVYLNAYGSDNDPITLYRQYDDATHYVHIYYMKYYPGSGSIRYLRIYCDIANGGSTLSMYASYGYGWTHVALMRGWGGAADDWALVTHTSSGTSTATTTNSIEWPDLAAVVTIGGSASTTDLTGWIDELRLSKGIARWTSTFNTFSAAYFGGERYFFIGSPLKLNGIKVYVSNPNTESVTLVADTWTGASWTGLTITDGTDVSGASMGQTGSITWNYSEDPKVLYLNGSALYFYRFDFNGGNADIYKTTVSAPLQNIRDVWNGSPRTCISFQFYDSPMFEDYTFQVSAKDSSDDSIYAAAIGGMSQTNDYLDIAFDDRSMGIKFDMLSSKVNSSAIVISSVEYWNGSAFQTVGYFSDGTLDSSGTESFAKSGVLSWSPPSSSEEFPKEVYGITGYVYRIKLTGAVAVTADTSIDLVTGITAPLDMTGYNLVGMYNRRVMLVNGNRVDYSQTDAPWIFNGVDSSDGGRLSLYFGDDNPITATGSIYNRYGSNLIEAWIVTKSNSSYTLTGVQPYAQFDNPFVIKTVSQNIGCAAPMSMASAIMEIGDGLRMGVAAWLDFSGPIAFNGAEPIRIEGIENFFDLTETTHLNYSYINKATSYIDTIHDEWNLLFPTGDSTANSKWVVYSFRHKKWYEKAANVGDVVLWDGSGDAVLWDSSGDAVLWDSGQYLACASGVTDTNGARYNYGFLTTGYMMRLDNGSTWDNSEIAQQIRTGYFSPPIEDDFGFWTRSEIRGLRLISGAMTENRAVLASILNDGVLSSNSLQIDLDSGKPISKNYGANRSLAEQAEVYQIDFTTSTSVNKWEPLAWGYKARMIRED